MRIDQTLANNLAHTAEYLSCLLKTASYQIENPISIPDSSINFCDSVLARRFETLTQTKNKSTSPLAVIVFLSISFFIYVTSYFITFEANYFPPEMFTDDIIIPTQSNCFLIERPDGQYDFYLLGEYIEVYPDKKYCISRIHTYKNIEEARKHEKIISEK